MAKDGAVTDLDVPNRKTTTPNSLFNLRTNGSFVGSVFQIDVGEILR